MTGVSRLLDGPPFAAGAERLADHRRRIGPLPEARDRHTLLPLLEASGLLGRGGAAFPVGRKWRSVADRAFGDAVVLANGAEGEPLSAKDRVLMTSRPHLVLDGAELAADAVGAQRIVLYVGAEHRAAATAMARAASERPAGPAVVELVAAPPTYVAGEESAAVHFVNDADARPTTVPPRPYERGIDGRPKLVQNVESLATAALIARFGDAWYRSMGRGAVPGTALVTVSSAPHPGVREIELGVPLGELAATVGADVTSEAVLVGGYFGAWLRLDEAGDVALDPLGVRAAGGSFGCGVVAFLPPGSCGVAATAQILDYVAGQSAAQCGPCVFGLRAIADTAARLARGRAEPDDLERIARWGSQLVGRGACRHPDGAAGLLASALRVFGAEFRRHATRRGCTATDPTRRAA